MKLKLAFSALIISFAIKRIESLDTQDNDSINRASAKNENLKAFQPETAAIVNIEQPTLPPVDIRIHIGSTDENTINEEDAEVEYDPPKTDDPTMHNTKPIDATPSIIDKVTKNPTPNPSMHHSTTAKNLESKSSDLPADLSNPGINWCPIHFSGDGNVCNIHIPSDANWVQCAYSKFTEISGEIIWQTCTCRKNYRIWDCKNNAAGTETSDAVTSEPIHKPTITSSSVPVETTTLTPSISPIDDLSGSQIDQSSSSPSDNLLIPSPHPTIISVSEPPMNLSENSNTEVPDVSHQLEPSVSPSSLPLSRPTIKPSKETTLRLSPSPSNEPSPLLLSPLTSPSLEPTTDISDELSSKANEDSSTINPSSPSKTSPFNRRPGLFGRRTAPPASSTKSDNTTDTSHCKNASTIDRRNHIFQFISSLTDADVFDDPDHPAVMAGSWISDDDQLQVCPEDQNFIQRYVLALLYFSTSGDDWARCTRNKNTLCRNERFLSATHECNWGGITCDSQNRVRKLNLDENNMRGPIPYELKYLERLYELDFDSNSLVGHFPNWLGSMKYLEKLDLDRNVLSGPIPEELYSSTSLRYVDMDRNILTGTISSKIGAMSQLVFFQVDFNQLIGTIPAEIGNILNLQYFSVFGNGFDESVGIPFEICGLNVQIYANCEMCTDIGDCCTVCLPEDASNYY